MYISAGQLKTHQAGIACGANLAKENWEALNGVRQVRRASLEPSIRKICIRKVQLIALVPLHSFYVFR